MGEKVELKPESLLNLDDLLQCPVCYEIPTGQIFQCNEGHHVCGRCKVRLDVCPVCRALFFGTRNYAMEELIANFRKVRAFKSGVKASAGSGSSASSTTTKETSVEPENDVVVEDITESEAVNQQLRAPPACKGLFRCLCCKIGKTERLPTARLLNHLRYFHAPDLIEGRSENGEYIQAWQFSTSPGRLVTAVRVADMGIFFLIIEIESSSIHAWLQMASSPWVAQTYNYTITLSGVDREAIFNDSVSSVRSCEGTLKKRGHCLMVTGQDALALMTPTGLSGKLAVRLTPPDQLTTQTQPRAVMRVANRGTENIDTNNEIELDDLEPFIQDLQNDVRRLSRAYASLGREAAALFRSEAENNASANRPDTTDRDEQAPQPSAVEALIQNGQPEAAQPMSRNARRRLRQQLRAVMNEVQGTNPQPTTIVEEPEVELISVAPSQNGRHESTRPMSRNARRRMVAVMDEVLGPNAQPPTIVEEPEVELIGVITQHGAVNLRRQPHLANSQPQLVNGHNTNGPSTEQTTSGGSTRANRRKRHQRR